MVCSRTRSCRSLLRCLLRSKPLWVGRSYGVSSIDFTFFLNRQDIGFWKPTKRTTFHYLKPYSCFFAHFEIPIISNLKWDKNLISRSSWYRHLLNFHGFNERCRSRSSQSPFLRTTMEPPSLIPLLRDHCTWSHQSEPLHSILHPHLSSSLFLPFSLILFLLHWLVEDGLRRWRRRWWVYCCK